MIRGSENFCIVGATAGATLSGLLFVAITLGAGLGPSLHHTPYSASGQARHLKVARRLCHRLARLYWLPTKAPRPCIGPAYPRNGFPAVGVAWPSKTRQQLQLSTF